MEPSYLFGEDHYRHLVGFINFTILKVLYDAGYELRPFYFKDMPYNMPYNYDLVVYAFDTVFGEENVKVESSEHKDNYEIEVKELKNLDYKELQEIQAFIDNIMEVEMQYNLWGEDLFKACYVGKESLQFTTYPANVELVFVKVLLRIVQKIKEVSEKKVRDIYVNVNGNAD